jgi:hypothetical protein
MSVDPMEMIRRAKPGTVIYGFCEEEGRVHIDFLMREASDKLAALPPHPPVEFRAGALLEQHVFLVVVMVRLTPDGTLFETFWNYHRRETLDGSGHLFEHMGAEPTLTLNLVGDSGEVENVIEVANPLRGFFQDAAQQAAGAFAWTLAEFDGAKRSVMEAYPEAELLWNALKPTHKPGKPGP